MFRRNALALAALAALSACDSEVTGHGIGRPPAQPGSPADTVAPMAITEVYLAVLAGDSPSVTIDVDSAACSGTCGALTLDSLQLCSQLACTPLSGSTPQTINGATLTALLLNPSADELAVLDDAGVVYAYLAWGAAPEVLGSRFAAAAVISGASDPGSYIPLPFPMPTGVAAAQQGDVRGCAAPGGAIDATLCVQPAPIMQILEVMPQHAADAQSWIAVEITDPTVPLFGARICLPPYCAVLDREVVAPADGFWMIYLGQEPPAEPDAEPSLGELYLPGLRVANQDDELLLLAPGSTNLGEPSDIQSYVRFGNIDSPLAASATDAALWSGAEDSVPAPRLTGESVSLSPGSDPSQVGSWAPTEATPAAANLTITADNEIWTSCSAPKQPAAAAPLFIHALRAGEPTVVELGNRGELPARLEQLTLLFDNQLHAIGTLALEQDLAVALAPGEQLALELPEGVFIGESGAAMLLLDDMPQQFFRWGTGGDMDPSDAIAAGLWPELGLLLADGTIKTIACSMDAIISGDSIELITGRVGYSPADYQAR